MTQDLKPIGRPTFRIDATRLKALRREAGLTQLALAQRVYTRAGKGNASAGVMKTSAQRWEKTGAVPLEIAKYLAEELKTTTAVLQGALPEPAPSRVDEIERRIRHLIAVGSSPELIAALEHYQGEDKSERELASHLTLRLEAAQLSQAQDEFEGLAALTGFTVGELRQPMSYEGFWLLMGTGNLGPARSEILSGVTEVLHAVRTELQECLERSHESDAHVSFMEEKHWFRVSFTHARLPQLTRTLRFVRCQPNESGLLWSSPTWLDRFWLETLPYEAYGHANFVTGFDSVRVPAECTNLRLAITKNPGRQEYEELGNDARPEIICFTEGDLAELPSETLDSFRREGISHDLVVNWLAADLWEKLVPFMSEWPLECWSVSLAQARIDIHLDVPYRLYATSTIPPRFGNRLSVILVEQSADGVLKRAPWRPKSVAHVHERLEASLQRAREMLPKSSSHLCTA
jgi:transcriptional regulator with XRE-family HTH domain